MLNAGGTCRLCETLVPQELGGVGQLSSLGRSSWGTGEAGSAPSTRCCKT